MCICILCFCAPVYAIRLYVIEDEQTNCMLKKVHITHVIMYYCECIFFSLHCVCVHAHVLLRACIFLRTSTQTEWQLPVLGD